MFFSQQRIKNAVASFPHRPDIYIRRPHGSADVAAELKIDVMDWSELRRKRELEMLQHFGVAANTATTIAQLRPLSKNLRTHKGKSAGRNYTSKYRGVHQTFPTRRWEAQFRRNGKPTSLGCFDHEEEAARAYDKMMLWCNIHSAGNVKQLVTNFDPVMYDGDLQWLHQVTQDELVQILRSDGRRQAAQRSMRQKREPNAQGPGPTREKQQHHNHHKETAAPPPPPTVHQPQPPQPQPQQPLADSSNADVVNATNALLSSLSPSQQQLTSSPQREPGEGEGPPTETKQQQEEE